MLSDSGPDKSVAWSNALWCFDGTLTKWAITFDAQLRSSPKDRCSGIIAYCLADNTLMYLQYPPDICFYSHHQTLIFCLEQHLDASNPGVGLANALRIC